MKILLIFLCLTAFLPKCQAEWFIGPEIEHMSGPRITEQGYGLNTLFANITYHDKGFYAVFGVGIHDESTDCPEVCFGDNLLVRFRAGWEFKL